MRALLLVILAALVLVPTAGAVVVGAEGSSTAGGMRWSWSASYDTQSKDLTFECKLVNADDGVTPVAVTPTTVATVSITQANGQQRSLDCVPLMNLGPQLFANANLKVDTVGRWQGYYITTAFTP